MSVYRPKGSKTFHYDFWRNGVRFCGSCQTEKKSEAKDVEARKKSEITRGQRQPDELKVSQAIGEYWNKHGKFKKSSKDIEQKLERLMSELGPYRLISSVSDRDIQNYIAGRREKVSNASVNRDLVLFRAVCNFCKIRMKVNTPDIHWRDHMLDEPKERVRSLTADEERKLFEYMRADFHPLISFCLMTGARLSSAIRLTWADIQDGTIWLTVKSKTVGDRHPLPVSDELQTLLDSVHGHHPIYVFTYQCDKGRAGRKKGERYPFSKTGWRRDWQRALKKAKIKDFRFHDLRHTAATRILKQQGNIATVKRVLGHQDITSTMRYAHVDMEDLKRALSRRNPEETASQGDKTKEYSIKSVA